MFCPLLLLWAWNQLKRKSAFAWALLKAPDGVVSVICTRPPDHLSNLWHNMWNGQRKLESTCECWEWCVCVCVLGGWQSERGEMESEWTSEQRQRSRWIIMYYDRYKQTNKQCVTGNILWRRRRLTDEWDEAEQRWAVMGLAHILYSLLFFSFFLPLLFCFAPPPLLFLCSTSTLLWFSSVSVF